MMRVGFIGLGSQGLPMAQRILGAGYETNLWARRPETLEPFAGTNAVAASTPAELASKCDLVCVCVMNDADVDEVCAALLPGLREGGVLVIHSTVHPSTCTRIAEEVALLGVAFADAPVSGGGAAAAEGRLEVIVGSDDETFTRCLPVFATYGDPVIHVGPVGAGQVAKLVNNVLFMAQISLAEDAFELATGLGIGRDALAEVVSRGSGNSFAFGVMHALGSMDAFAAVGGDPLRKDVDIVAETAAGRGADTGGLVIAANDGLTKARRPPSR